MGECEVCGRTVSRVKRAEIDGVILEVCDDCVRLGKEMAEPRPVLLRKKPAETLEEGEDLASDFAERVRRAREKRNLKQEEAAKRMGVSLSVLKRIESGSRMEEKIMKRIQRFYNINLYEGD